MGSIDDFSELCRLCLVKDQVNIPIFDETSDIGQTFLKIESCLPVKVSRDDNLPKKICDGCSYKLDMLYIFRNTSIDSEKQLISWLSQAGLSTTSKDPLATTTKPEIMVKQETFEPSDTRVDGDSSDLGVDAHSYMMQQQQLPYQQDFDFGEPSSSAARLSDEPSPKRAKRAAALKKAPIEETEEDEEEDLDAAMQITKAEDEDSEDADQPDYVEAPSTSADDQPGPSGVGKGAVEAPSNPDLQLKYLCNVCLREFAQKKDFLKHHLFNNIYNCCKCGVTFGTVLELYSHLDEHKDETVVLDQDGEIVEEIVLNYEENTDTSDLLYVLDDAQCDNEVVVQEQKEKDNMTIVQLEHGYVVKQPPRNKPKPRPRQPRRRQVVPDFSATNYEVVEANEQIDFVHYKCLRCEQLFINKFGFFRHIERGKCYINNCDVCNGTFERNGDFYQHYVLHHVDRAICNFCFRTFMYEKNVKEHMLRHLDQFKHRCEECNKGFYTIREYRNHYNNRHMGIRYTCEFCSRSFADEYYFRKHLLTHEQASAPLE